MRKITNESAQAFYLGENYNKDNTSVLGDTFYLHGNLIAQKKEELINGFKEVSLTLYTQGWETTTTKERLNGILNWFNKGGIFQKNYKWYFQDAEGNVEPFYNGMEV